MKCPNCGAELLLKDDIYNCSFCGSSYHRAELQQNTQTNNEFRIVGGVLVAYLGNSAEVSVPAGTVSIGKEAFKNNVMLRKIIFPSTVTTIENNAFEGCANLTEIVGYSSISSYGDECFKFAGLKHVLIGSSVRRLGKGCFSRMPALEKVTYNPSSNLKLNHTFAYCPLLTEVEEDTHHFFPSYHTSLELLNNPGNTRPTFADAFVGTPYIFATINVEYKEKIDNGVCPECGGKVKKSLFHAKCSSCGIDYKN